MLQDPKPMAQQAAQQSPELPKLHTACKSRWKMKAKGESQYPTVKCFQDVLREKRCVWYIEEVRLLGVPNLQIKSIAECRGRFKSVSQHLPATISGDESEGLIGINLS